MEFARDGQIVLNIAPRAVGNLELGADLPLILILSGVIGGLIAFGMIGLFIGPVLLAVTWRLFSAWVHEIPAPATDPDVVLHELEDKNKQ